MGYPTLGLLALILVETAVIPSRDPDPQSRVDVSPLRYCRPPITSTVLQRASRFNATVHEARRHDWKRFNPNRNNLETSALWTPEDHERSEKLRYKLGILEMRYLRGLGLGIITIQAFFEADQPLSDWPALEVLRGEPASYPDCNDTDLLVASQNWRARIIMRGVVYDLGATLQAISSRMDEADRLSPEQLFDGLQALVRMAACDSTGGKSILPGIGPSVYKVTAEKLVEYGRACAEDVNTQSFAVPLVDYLIAKKLIDASNREESIALIKLIEQRHFSQPAFFPRRCKKFAYIPRSLFHFLQLLPRLGVRQETPYSDHDRDVITAALIHLLNLGQENWRRMKFGNDTDAGKEVVEDIAADMYAIIQRFQIDAVAILDYLVGPMPALVTSHYNLYPLPPFAVHDVMIQTIETRDIWMPWDEIRITSEEQEAWRKLVAVGARMDEMQRIFDDNDNDHTSVSIQQRALTRLCQRAEGRMANQTEFAALIDAVRQNMEDAVDADIAVDYFAIALDFLLDCIPHQLDPKIMAKKRRQWHDDMAACEPTIGPGPSYTLWKRVVTDPFCYVTDVRDQWLPDQHHQLWRAVGLEDFDPTVVESDDSYPALLRRLGLGDHVAKLTLEFRQFGTPRRAIENLSSAYYRHYQPGQSFVEWLRLSLERWTSGEHRQQGLRLIHVRLWYGILREWGANLPPLPENTTAFVWDAWAPNGWTLEVDKPKILDVCTLIQPSSWQQRHREWLHQFLSECPSPAHLPQFRFENSGTFDSVWNYVVTHDLTKLDMEVSVFRALDEIYDTDLEGRILGHVLYTRTRGLQFFKDFLGRLLLTPALRALGVWAFNMVVRQFHEKGDAYVARTGRALTLPAEVLLLMSLFQFLGDAWPCDTSALSTPDTLILAWVAGYHRQPEAPECLVGIADADLLREFSIPFRALCDQILSAGCFGLDRRLLMMVEQQCLPRWTGWPVASHVKRRQQSAELTLFGVVVAIHPELLPLFEQPLSLFRTPALIRGVPTFLIAFSELALLYLWMTNGRICPPAGDDGTERRFQAAHQQTKSPDSPLHTCIQFTTAGVNRKPSDDLTRRRLRAFMNSVGDVLLHFSTRSAVARTDPTNLEPTVIECFDSWHLEVDRLLKSGAPASTPSQPPSSSSAVPALVDLDELDLAIGPFYALRGLSDIFSKAPQPRGQERWVWAGAWIASGQAPSSGSHNPIWDYAEEALEDSHYLPPPSKAVD